jgi:lipopolysaccharide/colanic/teichoic acid biosynthesis glycosyltransferase
VDIENANVDETIIPVHLGIRKKIYLGIKRVFDFFASLISLILLSPIFLIIIVAIKLDSKGPAILVQDRIGKNGKLFKFYKFRSMVIDADEVLFKLLDSDEKIREEYSINKKLENDPRITRVGKFIRKLSLDELPQLYNVLKGDMSLIGNRPYLPREKDDMGSYYDFIVASKPGLTGYWQTSGRSKTTFEARLNMEKEYSKNMCLGLDIKIFFKTIMVLFDGI